MHAFPTWLASSRQQCRRMPKPAKNACHSAAGPEREFSRKGIAVSHKRFDLRACGVLIFSARWRRDMEFTDRLLTCIDCGGEFIFTAGEQLFFFDKQFKNDPKRCKPCKSKRYGGPAKQGAGPAAAGLSRTETRTNCSECGIETTVVPSSSRHRDGRCCAGDASSPNARRRRAWACRPNCSRSNGRRRRRRPTPRCCRPRLRFRRARLSLSCRACRPVRTPCNLAPFIQLHNLQIMS